MVLIVHLDKSILFLDYKNILISITSLQQKISMKKKIQQSNFYLLWPMTFAPVWYIPQKHLLTNKKRKRKRKKR